ncbi:MAG: desulfoferrodoxin family protein [bacterium]
MKKYFSLLICCMLFCQLFLSVIFAESDEMEADKTLFETKCSLCHAIERPLSKKKNKDGWMGTVKRMQSKRPGHLSDAEVERIIGYLVYARGEEPMKINKAKDPSNMTELERKHVPVIQLGEENKEKKTLVITVKIGEDEHPMVNEHYIKYIELFIDNKSAGKVDLKPGDKPEAEFEVKSPVSGHVTAQENCNIHGLWEGEVK